MKRAYPKLRERMKLMHINQEDIAREIVRSRRYVNGCMNGESCFTEKELYIIAELLKLENLGDYFNQSERAGFPERIGNGRRYRLKNYEMADALIYKGKSLNNIADECFLNRGTLMKIFRGEWVSFGAADIFADYLGMGLEELFNVRKYHEINL